MRRVLLLLIGLLALAGVGVASSGGATEAQPHWVITHLGSLGGKWSAAYEVNEQGQIVGQYDKRSSGGPVGGAFLWDAGRMIDIGPKGAQSSWPVAWTSDFTTPLPSWIGLSRRNRAPRGAALSATGYRSPSPLLSDARSAAGAAPAVAPKRGRRRC